MKSIKTLLPLCLLLLASCSSSSATETAVSSNSPPHHLDNGRYQNPAGSPASTATFTDMVKFFTRQMFNTPDPEVPEGHVLPAQEQGRQLARTNNPSLTWLGHAAFIIRISEKVIITDPYLGRVAGPWGMGPSRFVDSPVKAEELPRGRCHADQP